MDLLNICDMLTVKPCSGRAGWSGSARTAGKLHFGERRRENRKDEKRGI